MPAASNVYNKNIGWDMRPLRGRTPLSVHSYKHVNPLGSNKKQYIVAINPVWRESVASPNVLATRAAQIGKGIPRRIKVKR